MSLTPSILRAAFVVAVTMFVHLSWLLQGIDCSASNSIVWHTKASQENDIPVKLLKANADNICEIIFTYFNNNLVDKGLFPESLKTANVTPVFKKDSRTDKTNYRPVSILPNLSKVYERLIYNQLSNFFENKLPKFQCGFRKGYNAQDCLLVMIEKWKRMLDKGGTCGALLTDLSKAFSEGPKLKNTSNFDKSMKFCTMVKHVIKFQNFKGDTCESHVNDYVRHFLD